MNASPHHSKVRVSLKFAETRFTAGAMVTGKLELECKAEKGLGISVIMVELYAIEGMLCHHYLRVASVHGMCACTDSTGRAHVQGSLRYLDVLALETAIPRARPTSVKLCTSVPCTR